MPHSFAGCGRKAGWGGLANLKLATCGRFAESAFSAPAKSGAKASAAQESFLPHVKGLTSRNYAAVG